MVKELKKRKYSVATIKEIHYEDFAIDKSGTDTSRHKNAGAELVTARGYHETDILYPDKLPINKILKHYDHEYIVIEGVEKGNFPKIISARTEKEIEERLDDTVIAITGVIANRIDEYKGLPVINSLEDIEKLVDLIEEKAFEKLPDFPKDCCTACGYSCEELSRKIIKGEAKRDDCVISNSEVKLYINEQKIEMVPFVQDILKNALIGVVSELEGYEKNAKIEVEFEQLNEDE
mgnify:CR=1 FL=1